jgi:hypothetical protein
MPVAENLACFRRLQEVWRHQQQGREARSTKPSATMVSSATEQMDTRCIPDNLCQLPFSIALHRNHYHLLHLLHPLLSLPPARSLMLSMPSTPATATATLGSPHASSHQLQDQVQQLEMHLLSGAASEPGSTQAAAELAECPPSSARSHPPSPAHKSAAPGCTTQYVPGAERDRAQYDVAAVEARLLRIGASSDLSDDSCTSSLHSSRSLTEIAGLAREGAAGWVAGSAGGGQVPLLSQLGLGDVQGTGLSDAGGLPWGDGWSAAAAEQGAREVQHAVEEVLQQLVAEVVGTGAFMV